MTDVRQHRAKLSAQAKSERARDQAAAMLEYEADRQAVQAKTERLRALRLAKEAADRETAAVPRPKPVRRRRAVAKTK